ncbi:flavohemoglobin expression-modulating QEGLA motif protein [Litorimonas sp. RW-G-Af-16]|uniref:flavohemoglobin expression-modulating QEGLA motif protein n=1 Tax=Litorimonas sp. RW-G-Af-16 TaxID=3241168 RepID=UPI00390CC7AB
MNPLSPKLFDKAVEASGFLEAAASEMRVLSSMEWKESWRDKFLATKALPKPRYAKVDTGAARAAIADARQRIDGDHVVLNWLSGIATTLETTANLIDARGTKAFFQHSVALYGQPTQFMLDKTTRVLDLAEHMDGVLAELDFDNLVIAGYETQLSSTEFVRALRPRLTKHFGEEAPRVRVSSKLSAKASASSSRIRVRKDATFTERDIDQLLQHEALIHVATGMNGKAQENFQILGRAHAGTTEVQEGLAVFAEIISGAMDPRRFRRLSGRVLAIDMAIQGADFKEVYDFFDARVDEPEQAYENTRRVFRGGVTSGGAPFTKDMVYLNGLLRVHNFMRTVVRLGRADLIRVLFCGKMDINDLPALAQLASAGRLTPPKFMPPWAKDLRFLVSYMAYSSFLNQVKMPGFQAHYEEALRDVPEVWSLTS